MRGLRRIRARLDGPRPVPLLDAERAVDDAYWLILGREPDEMGKRSYVDQLARGAITVDDVCVALVQSREFQTRLGAAPSAALPAPDAHGDVDVRHLLATLSVEELAKAADDYYRVMGNPEYYLAKPLTNIDEAPDFLICFGQILAGLRPVPGMVVLDFGAGTCWTSRWLTQMGYEVIALDVSEVALELGRQLYERLPVVGTQPPPRFLKFDGRRIDLPDESVDRILCFDSFHHVPNQAEVLAEMARVLRSGGVAGFSEPGPHHSTTAQSQFEMKNYTVIENDIVMSDVSRLAHDAGFTSLDLSLFSAQPHRVTLEQYDEFLAGGRATGPYCDHVRKFAEGRRNFFLTKGGALRRDSRDRQGLYGDVRLTIGQTTVGAGEALVGECHVRNTGSNEWLTTEVGAGLVQLGVHLYDAAGRLLDRDYARVPLPVAPTLPPGGTVIVPYAVPAPPPGQYRLEFDLVSELVCWFEINGCPTASVEIVVA
jgi:SAM-dependent methyltransferase